MTDGPDEVLERLDEIEGRLDKLDRAFVSIVGPGGALRSGPVWAPGWEYRSRATFLGLPLLHVAQGVNPATGRPRIAVGWFALGNIAVGGIAFGGVSVGLVAIGGMALGVLVAVAGVSVACGLALGGLAIGTVAVGGLAVGFYALGGAAFGAHVISSDRVDPEAVAFFRRYVPGIERVLPPPPAERPMPRPR